MFRIFKKLKFWKKGSSDAFGFIVMTPVVIAVFILTVNMVRLTSLKQKMEYTAYVACRAAVVSDNIDKARVNAQKVAEEELRSYSHVYNASGVKFNIIREIPGTGYTEKFYETSGYDSRTDTKRTSWVKGNFLECELIVDLNTNFLGLSGGTSERKCKIVMAIEKDDY